MSIKQLFALAAAFCFLCLGNVSRAGVVTIASHNVPSSSSSNAAAIAEGESFTTAASGPWNNITFNFYSNSSLTTPSAYGDLYLLNTAYAGTPAALSSSTPGFLAEATTISNGEYVFGSSVQLSGSTQYFVYSDALFPIGTQYTDLTSNPSTGDDFFSSGTASAFTQLPVEGDFAVQGTAVPEPTCLGMILVGGLGLLRRRGTAQLRAA